MPLYKWIGNQVLTAIENRMLGSHLSEFHSGYRAYKVDALRSIRFELNSDDFHFDTEILIQLLATGRVVKEIPVPTFYGDEISHVNGLRYAANCLKAVTKARLGHAGVFYEPKFDFGALRRERLSRQARRQHASSARSSRASGPPPGASPTWARAAASSAPSSRRRSRT